jgi:zinc protease
MKTLFTIILSVCCFLTASAQYETTSFDVDGIKVIFKPTPKKVINIRMFYRGGVTNYPANMAGIESFTLAANTQCGTKKYTANEFKDKTDKYDIRLTFDNDYDYGNIEMECVSKYFNEGWDLFTEAVVAPSYNAEEVALLKNKMLARIRQEQSDPDKRVTSIAIKSAFEGTPYATNPSGEDEVIAKLTADDLKNYYSRILNKNQIFIVVSGKISKEELTEKVKTSFGSLPSKAYTPAALTSPVWKDNTVVTEPREVATNYINALMNAPKVNSPDFVPFRLGMSAFGGLLFSQLRTRLNLSYRPGAYAVMKQMPYAIMFVSTTNPKDAVTVMATQLNRIKGITISDDGLKEIKSAYITNNYIKQQSSSAITESLGEAEILGDWKMADQLPQLLDKVTATQINNTMNKYIGGLKWSYLGNPQLAEETMSAFKKK